MRSAAALAGLSLALGSCAFSAPEDAYTVEEVVADITSPESRLDGKIVSVQGWLGECAGTSCAIFSSVEDAEKVAAFRELPDEEWMSAYDRGLSIGANDDFDGPAVLMQFSEVIVTGEINATWRKPPDENGNQFGCFDRCDDIRPQSIRKIIF